MMKCPNSCTMTSTKRMMKNKRTEDTDMRKVYHEKIDLLWTSLLLFEVTCTRLEDAYETHFFEIPGDRLAVCVEQHFCFFCTEEDQASCACSKRCRRSKHNELAELEGPLPEARKQPEAVRFASGTAAELRRYRKEKTRSRRKVKRPRIARPFVILNN
jgi:hypothetical protein